MKVRAEVFKIWVILIYFEGRTDTESCNCLSEGGDMTNRGQSFQLWHQTKLVHYGLLWSVRFSIKASICVDLAPNSLKFYGSQMF